MFRGKQTQVRSVASIEFIIPLNERTREGKGLLAAIIFARSRAVSASRRRVSPRVGIGLYLWESL